MIGYAEDRSTLRVHNCNDQLGWNLPLPDGKGTTNRPSARPNPLSINLPGARRGRASSRDVVPRVPLQEIVPGLVREGQFSVGSPIFRRPYVPSRQSAPVPPTSEHHKYRSDWAANNMTGISSASSLHSALTAAGIAEKISVVCKSLGQVSSPSARLAGAPNLPRQ